MILRMYKNYPILLIINGGSSSIKFALYQQGHLQEKTFHGQISRIGMPGIEFIFHDAGTDTTETVPVEVNDYPSAINWFINWLEKKIDLTRVKAIGHRVVHGMHHTDPSLITATLLDELKQIIRYDPDHLPNEIKLIEAFKKHYPEIIQVACFDTSFHSGMPRMAKLLPLPRRYDAMGIQRYGFHGLSYAYLMEELSRIAEKETAGGKIILAHLGNGASLAAVKNGKSIDTSMGFTPASGLVMGTRTGDLDPGVAWFLMQSEKMNAAQFNHLINHESGLLGISETNADMQALLTLQLKDKRAMEAVELFCYQTKKWIGSFAAVLEGLDTLIFSGGIGENSPEIRTGICNGLQFLGIELDEKRNADNNGIISADNSRVTVRVIQTNEELMIARSVDTILNNLSKK